MLRQKKLSLDLINPGVLSFCTMRNYQKEILCIPLSFLFFLPEYVKKSKGLLHA